MSVKKLNSEILGYNLLMLPGILLLVVFAILPMVGIVIAFQHFIPAKGILGSEWVGLENFKLMYNLPDSWKVLGNTLVLAISKMAVGTVIPILFALMLNEPDIKKEDLEKINIPVLVLAGDKDLVLEEDTRFIARNIPYATLKILKGESHTSYIVHSEKIAHEILNYCVSQ